MNFHHFFSAGIIAPGNMTKALKKWNHDIGCDCSTYRFNIVLHPFWGWDQNIIYAICFFVKKILNKKPLLYKIITHLPIYYHALLTYVFLLNKVFYNHKLMWNFTSCKEIKAFSYLITTPYPFLYSPLLLSCTDYFNTIVHYKIK